MRGYRFYADFGSSKAKRKGGDAPNVLAVLLDDIGRPLWHGDNMMDTIAAVFDYANSSVAGTGASRGYVRECCKRIGETEARRIHPAMFAWLDSFDESGNPKRRAAA